MLYWTVGLLALDMALMGGILYTLFYRKGFMAHAMDGTMEGAPAATGASFDLMEKIKDELETAQRLTTELDRKRRSLDSYEKALSEKEMELDGVIKSARASSVPTGPLPRKRKADDVYQKAMTMMSKGAPVDEVTDMLGLLNGEAELIASVNRFKG